jgi:hypothetical protein
MQVSFIWKKINFLKRELRKFVWCIQIKIFIQNEGLNNRDLRWSKES